MLYNRISGWNLLEPGVVSCHFKMLMWRSTRPSVNYAEDWLDCDHYGAVNNNFPVYWAIFGMVTTEQPTNLVILEQACS